MSTIKSKIKLIVNYFLAKFDLQISSINNTKTYLDASETIEAAQRRNMTIRHYVEELWGQQGATEKVIKQMQSYGCFSHCDRILEIGAGTGRYLGMTLELAKPNKYDVYEIDKEWTNYLVKTYSPYIIGQPSDGVSLKSTPNNSCKLVHAHGVFVYLPFLSAFEYFSEMIRVCKSNSYIIFDVYTESEFTIEIIQKWFNYPDRYPVVLPKQIIIKYFEKSKFRLISEFLNKYGHSESRYLVFYNG